MCLCMMVWPFEVFVVVFENTEVSLPFRSIDRTACSIGLLNRSVRNLKSESSTGGHLFDRTTCSISWHSVLLRVVNRLRVEA
ncbi:hypothetical protein HanIR_Chr14g0695981 [Helianthus annuus]|nr:hypothetical protein HanIR_Chr14g0695981 [Helianthus annuus]